MNKLPEPRQLALTLRSEGSAEANGEDTITLTATLTDGDSLVSGEVITFIATNGAFFPDGQSSIISVTTDSQGKAVAGLACSTPGTFNVTALLARDSGVNASVSVVFGDGGSTGDLPAPAVDEAVNGRIPADTSTLTLRIPAWTGMATGDHLTYYWHASAADGTGSTLQDGFKLVSTDIGKDVVFNPDPGVAVAPYDGGTADVWYAVTPNDGGPAKESDHASWLVGEAKPLPAPGVEEADGNNIDLAGLSDNVHVSLSWPSMAVNDVVTLFWQGTDGSGTAHPEQQVTSHRVTDNDVQAGQVRLPLSVATYQMTPVFKTLFEDFEGNNTGSIGAGKTIILKNSGANLTNIPGRLDIRKWNKDLLSKNCLHTFGYQEIRIEFPIAFRYIRLAIIGSGMEVTFTFYDHDGYELEKKLYLEPNLGQSEWLHRYRWITFFCNTLDICVL